MPKMLTVYTLRERLENDPAFVESVQALTLNSAKPTMGLNARFGLFGSPEWWSNVENGTIKRAEYFGVIAETYCAGMDSDRRHNSFRMTTDDGRDYSDSMMPERSRYRGLYTVGHRVEVTTIFEELKKLDPTGAPELLESPLTIRLSTKPVI